MTKPTGGTRKVKPASGTRLQKYQTFLNEIGMEDVNKELSYFSKRSGGYVITMVGRRNNDEEMEVARAMADDGLLVVLTPEGGIRFRTNKTKKGGYHYADGLVNGLTYEQKTKRPQGTNTKNLVNAIDNALQHAKDKQVQVPLIYDRYGKFHREHIEAGLAQFEDNFGYRFKAILVVDKDGNVHEHQHNKK